MTEIRGAAATALLGALGAFLLVTVLQRLAELALSWRNARRVRARGAVEHRADGFPGIVLLHVLFPVALVAEVAVFGAVPGPATVLWLALWLLAQALRYWAVWALGDRWNVRVLVMPGEPPVRRGPYRWLRHPNYLAVRVEMFAGPMIFGAWWTAVVFTLANWILLSRRVRVEERALAQVNVTPEAAIR